MSFMYKIIKSHQANIAWITSTRGTIENDCITFEIYLDAKKRVIFSLYGWGYSITYKTKNVLNSSRKNSNEESPIINTRNYKH